MFVTVMIPTYCRPKDLNRCLMALEKQTRPVDEILVIIRDSDSETWTYINTFNTEQLPIITVKVSREGVVAAMNAGLDVAQGDIIAITDDDAAPHIDWIEKLEHHFLADEKTGGVGGRDWLYVGTELQDASIHPGANEPVGKMNWFGRVTGNHHIGEGQSREVDVLKGVNSSFRRSALLVHRFDERLRGSGAQVHWELAICQAMKRSGWKIIYDPTIAVDHYLGKRFDEDQRNIIFNAKALRNETHNETLVLLENLPFLRRVAFMIWALVVGHRQALGAIQWLRFFPSQGKLSTNKWVSSMSGRWQGWLTWQYSKSRE
jgi:glycosyltransferase involved in cell wall biosynthesis